MNISSCFARKLLCAMIDVVNTIVKEQGSMADPTFEVRIPSALLQFGLDQREIERRLTEWLVLSLFTDGYISSGKAARLLNMSRVEFLALLRTRGIAYINYTPNELAEELAAVDQLNGPPLA